MSIFCNISGSLWVVGIMVDMFVITMTIFSV